MSLPGSANAIDRLTGAGPAELQPDTGCPTRGSFTGGLLRTLPGMFIGHSEIVAFLLYRFDADKPTPLLRHLELQPQNLLMPSASRPTRETATGGASGSR